MHAGILFPPGRPMRAPTLSFPVATGTLPGSFATRKRERVSIGRTWSL